MHIMSSTTQYAPPHHTFTDILQGFSVPRSLVFALYGKPYDKHVGTAYKHQHVQSLEGSHKAIFNAQWGLKQQVLSYLE